MKKIFLFTFALFTLSFANWSGGSSQPETVNHNGGTYYNITTAEELAWVAAKVNGGSTEINILLANDIVMGASTSTTSNTSWTPIGNSSKNYSGTFDGNGFTIYGLFISIDKKLDQVGLIGNLAKKGVVKNVNMKAASISGYSNYPTPTYSGGIVGRNDGTIKFCSFGGSVWTNANYTGAVKSYAGGIVGYNTGSLSDVTNSGSAKAYYAGGIAGYTAGTINRCVNTGSSAAGGSAGVDHEIGGIASENNGEITNCINSGSATANARAGGFVSLNLASGIIKNCINISSNIKNVESGYTNYASGLASRNVGTIINSYYDKTVLPNAVDISSKVSGSTVTNSSGKKTNDMQTNEFAWILNTTNGTETNSGEWTRYSGYPVLSHGDNFPIYKVIFDINGTKTALYTSGDGSLNFPDDPIPVVGTSFTGWKTSTGVVVDNNSILQEDLTLYASFAPIVYTVKFFNADSSLLATKHPHYDEYPEYDIVPSMEKTKQYSFKFKGWGGDIVAAHNDTNYYAVYDSILVTYLVKLVVGTDEILSESVPFGPYVLPNAPEKEGYSFEGWFNGSKKLGFANDMILVDADILAIASYQQLLSSSSEETIKSSSSKEAGKSTEGLLYRYEKSRDITPNLSVSTDSRTIRISGMTNGSKAQVFDIQGNLVASHNSNSTSLIIAVPNSGLYILKIGNRSQRITIK